MIPPVPPVVRQLYEFYWAIFIQIVVPVLLVVVIVGGIVAFLYQTYYDD